MAAFYYARITLLIADQCDRAEGLSRPIHPGVKVHFNSPQSASVLLVFKHLRRLEALDRVSWRV
jgi:hypothetical protein